MAGHLQAESLLVTRMRQLQNDQSEGHRTASANEPITHDGERHDMNFSFAAFRYRGPMPTLIWLHVGISRTKHTLARHR